MTYETLIQIPSEDPRLGRNIVHDERSRAFPLLTPIDKSTWRDKAVRIYDPIPNPNQTIGNCTGCAKAMEFNAVGNRVAGRVLKMVNATAFYARATEIDPFPGTYPPEDTGSSGLAAAKAAVEQGYGGEYRWLFRGADEIVQAVMDGHVVNVGTWWYEGMMPHDYSRLVHPTGMKVGGHQWIVRGYDKSSDWVMGRCWWGTFRDFWITRSDLQNLMMDDGDAHIQVKA